MFKLGVRVLAVVLASVVVAGQESKGYDEILDTYVRDGEVYYRALKSDRAKLDAYVSRLASVSIDSMPKADQMAFWINAYNALVLRTVIDHYPIQRHTNAYPQRSIRQIPGAFERLTHRVAGRTLALDQIEQNVLSTFGDPRVYLALGRGSEGGGRLRSEVFSAERLDAQLTEAAAECITRQQCARIDPAGDRVVISPLFSWREKDFVAAYADTAPALFASRSPVERAVLGFLQPKLLTTEREFLQKNTFKVEYGEFDWRLNDLTGRGGR
jgi:uncharacterized protein DUF547